MGTYQGQEIPALFLISDVKILVLGCCVNAISNGEALGFRMRLTVRWSALLTALKDAWPVWLAVSGLVLASLSGCILSTTLSASVRFAGMVLQIFGLGTVAVGFKKMRQQFGRPSFGAKVFGWLRSLATAFTVPKSGALYAPLSDVFKPPVDDVRAVLRPESNAPLEQRILWIERELSRLQDGLDSKTRKLGQDLGELKGSIQHESQERRADYRKTMEAIENVAIGGLHLEMVGLLWLFLGILGTSIPDEIAMLLMKCF